MTGTADTLVPARKANGRRFSVFETLTSLPVVILILFVLLSLYDARIYRLDNILNILRNASYLLVVSLGQMLVLLLGGFDLSMGAVVALSSVATALSMVGLLAVYPDAPGLVMALGILAGLGVSGLLGLINGVSVGVYRLSPFMVTLATMTIAEGLALYMTSGSSIYGLPQEFTNSLGKFRVWNVPLVVFVALGLLLCLHIFLERLRVGRYFYAVGSSETAARMAGINVRGYLITAYTACALFAGMAGVLLTARVGSGEATLGGPLLTLQSITAAVIGGVSLAGGVGRAYQVALGVLLLALVTNGMNILRIDSKLQLIVVGLFLIGAVFIERMRQERVRR